MRCRGRAVPSRRCTDDSVFETVTEYTPTIPEIVITIGVYAIGALVVSLFWKIAIDVKKENGTFALKGN